ncbi:MAG: FG-GAP repeat domain-containing protein [Terriglobales bacterium]
MNTCAALLRKAKIVVPATVLVAVCIALLGNQGCPTSPLAGKIISSFLIGSMEGSNRPPRFNYASSESGVDAGPASAGGNAPYWNGMWRQSSCSLSQGTVDSSLALVSRTDSYQDLLHQLSGSTTTADQFAGGCTPVTTGITSQFGAIVGKLSNGNVAMANVSSDGVQVTIGTTGSSPTVVSQTDYATLTGTQVNAGAAVFGIASGDLNGDGFPDLVVASETDQSTSSVSLAVFLGSAAGSFSAGQVIAVPLGTPTGTAGAVIGTTIADVNGDGKLDLIAVTNFSSTGITVYLGNGDGTFAATGIAGPAGSAGQTAVVADFNGDGKPDIATSYGQILLGQGNGSFTLVSQTLAEKQAALTASDFNHDGKMDLAFSSSNAFTVDVYTGNGDGTFSYAGAYPQIVGGYSLQSTDLDGDGYPDLYVGTAQGGGFTSDPSTNGLSQELLNRGDGSFGKSRAYFTGSEVFDTADFTGDGHADLLSIGRADGTGAGGQGTGTGAPVLWVLKGAGDGTFQTLGISTAISGPVATTDVLAVAAADLNGDHMSDAVFAWGLPGTGETPQISVALGNGDGTFGAQQDYPVPGGQGVIPGAFGGTANALLLTDLNGDGKPDIVFIASPDGSVSASTGLYVLLNQGNGTFAAAQLVDSKPYMNYLAAADLNGDGHMDLVVSTTGDFGSSTHGAAYWYAGTGNGSFQAAVALTPGSNYPSVVAIADMNGDGLPDLIFAGNSSAGAGESVTVVLGNGNGTFQSGVTSTAAGNDAATGIAVVDLNSDGKPDVVLGSSSSPYFMAGDGTGNLSSSQYGYMGLGNNGAHLKVADLTGLQLGDLLLSSGSAIEAFVASSPPTPSPGFAISAAPAAGTATAAMPASTTVTVTPQNGFAGAVTLGCTGLPAGTSCTFSPATVTPSGAAATSTLTISVTMTGQAGASPSAGTGQARVR